MATDLWLALLLGFVLAAGAELWRLARADEEAKAHRVSPLNALRSEGWTIYTADEGLPSEDVHRLLEATTGELWASTGRGPARLREGRWEGFPDFTERLYYGYVGTMVLDAAGHPWVTGVEPGHSLWTPALHGVGVAHFDGRGFRTVRRGRFVHLAACYTGRVLALTETKEFYEVSPRVTPIALAPPLARGYCCGGIVCDAQGIVWGLGAETFGRLQGDEWVTVEPAAAAAAGYPGSRSGDFAFADCAGGVWLVALQEERVAVFRGRRWHRYVSVREAVAAEAAELRAPRQRCNTPLFAVVPGGAIYLGVERLEGRDWVLLEELRRKLPPLTLYAHLRRADGTHWVATSSGVFVPPAALLGTAHSR